MGFAVLSWMRSEIRLERGVIMIEKMLEKFEELRMRYFLTIANGGDEKLDCAYVCVGKAIDQCKEIVQEVAKEYGWVSVQDRLPSKEEYQKCNGQFIVSDGNRTYATYFDIYDTLRFGEPTMEKFRIDKCVIAWQPLPAPYQKGE